MAAQTLGGVAHEPERLRDVRRGAAWRVRVKVLRSTTFLALSWPALVWWAVLLSCVLLSAFGPFAAWELPSAEITALLMMGQVLACVYAVRAWRYKRWAAVAVDLSVVAITVVALLGLLD